MPVEISPPQLDPVDLSTEPWKLGGDSMTSAQALSLVRSTFWQYETFRTYNHDRRWQTHDALFFGYVPQRVWDGTTIPRACLAIPLVFDQVEAACPVINQALFGNDPWFEVDAEPGTNPTDARAIQDSLSYVLEHPRDDYGSNSVTELQLATKSTILYGNGGVSIEWDPVLERPRVEWVDIRDFYIDPGLSVPNIDESRSVIRRKMMTIEDLNTLRKDPRMNIPPLDVLYYMAKFSPQVYADQTKRVQEALRGVYFTPTQSDYLPNPSDQKVEVLIYYSKNRIIWVLNQQWVAFNGPNPYGFIPFAFAPCYIVPSRFYAMSMADVNEGNQRYVEALINGRLDEISLMLHPPRVQKRNTLMTPAQQRWRPGAVFTVNDKDDLTTLTGDSQLANIYTEVQYLETAAEKRTGVSAFANGIARPSNANRTAGGVQAQVQGSNSRLTYIVNNIELYLIVPTLYKCQKIMQFHSRPGQVLPAVQNRTQSTPEAHSPTGIKSYYQVDSSMIQKKVTFRMKASSRMITKGQLLQVLPVLSQFILQGPFMQELGQIGQTVDFLEFFRMYQDATGVGSLYNLIRPLNEQEQKARQQPPPQVQAMQQKSQADNQTRLQMGQMKVQGEIQKAQIMKQPDPSAQQVAQMQANLEAQQKQQEIQAEKEQSDHELQVKQAMAQIQIQAQVQKHKLDIAKAQADTHTKIQSSQADLQIQQMKHEQQMQQMLQAAQVQASLPQPQQSQGPGVAGAETTSPQTKTAQRPKKKAEVHSKPKPPSAT